jgi:hypothetical protein
MHALGFSMPAAILKWLEIEHNYSNEKRILVNDFLNYLAKWGHNPADFDFVDVIDEQSILTLASSYFNTAAGAGIVLNHVRMLFDLVVRAVTLKLWELTRDSIVPEDWLYEGTYRIFHRNVPDSTVDSAIEALHDKWANTQVKVPTGSMNSKFTLYYLPVTTNTSEGYQVYDAGDGLMQHDSQEWTGFPNIVFNEVDFESTQEIGPESIAERGFSFLWVDIRTLNDVDHEEILSYNRMTGEVDGLSSSQEVDSAVRIGVVYPHNLKRLKPLTRGLKFEKRHWPLIYTFPQSIAPIILVEYWAEWDMMNQRSWLGPKNYLISQSSLLRTGKGYKLTNIFGQLQDVLEGLYDSVTFSLLEDRVIAQQAGKVELTGRERELLKDAGLEE